MRRAHPASSWSSLAFGSLRATCIPPYDFSSSSSAASRSASATLSAPSGRRRAPRARARRVRRSAARRRALQEVAAREVAAAQPGSCSPAISSATPATAPRSAGGVHSAPLASSTTTLVRVPSTSRPRASKSSASSAPAARAASRARASELVALLGAARGTRARMQERRGDRAPPGGSSPSSRDTPTTCRPPSRSRDSESRAMPRPRTPRARARQRAVERARVDGRKPERAGVAQQAPHVARRRSAARRRESAPSCSSRARRKGRVVGAQDRGIGGVQRSVDPDGRRRGRFSADRAARSRSASGRCRSGAGVRS